MGMPNTFKKSLRHKERYQRPHGYNIPVGLGSVCVSPNKQMRPVVSFLVQADLNNTGIINVGDTLVTLANGVQLDPGRAWVFGVTPAGFLTGSLFNTQSNFAEAIGSPYQLSAPGNEFKVFIDIADFYAIADTPDQNLRIFWSTDTE
jgi:hypothetical protein